jgi:hypothetical protein
MAKHKTSTVNLLEAKEGTRFTIPSWLDLEELRVFIAGVDSDDEEESESDE